MAASYKPNVYRAQGATELTVSSGGMIAIEDGGILNIEAGGALQIGGSAFVTTGGNLSIGSLTSGDVTFPGKVTATSGLSASTGVFSSGAQFGGAVTFTSGFSATTGNFSGGVAVSSALTVANTLTLSSGFVQPYEQFATGASNPAAMAGFAVSEVWSSGSDSTAGRRYALAAPAAGVMKFIVCIASTATVPAYITTTGATALIDGSITGLIFSTGASNRQWVQLMGQNSTNWLLLAKSTDILTSTT
ncbi:MAG: hypothetical protein WC651_03190 [Candidatus Gracilibacteria bacterium]|jgi:hypothetical protein